MISDGSRTPPIPVQRTLLMLGAGCVGQAVLPLLLRHLDFSVGRLLVVSADEAGREQVEAAECQFFRETLTPSNFASVLGQHLGAGDFLLNLSIGVCSVSLLEWCRRRGVDYLDTCIEPWFHPGFDAARQAASTTNYSLREAALSMRQRRWRSTALVTHGANPGLSFHFLKQALLDFAAYVGVSCTTPGNRRGWAELARALDVRVVHVAEYDSQHEAVAADGDCEFANTWSVEGFAAESWQPAEIGWGSHERRWPHGASGHDSGCRSAIYLDRPGAMTRICSHTPAAGKYEGFLISLSDAIAISDTLSVYEGGFLTYRPTACYAYRPCDAAIASLRGLVRREGRLQPSHRLLKSSLIGGSDELGVLLVSPTFGSYWYGSRLTLERARELAPHNSATSLQVAAGVLAGLSWVLGQPAVGLLEPSDLPHEEVLHRARPYLGEVRSLELGEPTRDPAWIDRFLR